MADAVKMVVVDGVRYRAEDAPKGAEGGSEAPAKARPTAKNKARTASSTKG